MTHDRWTLGCLAVACILTLGALIYRILPENPLARIVAHIEEVAKRPAGPIPPPPVAAPRAPPAVYRWEADHDPFADTPR